MENKKNINVFNILSLILSALAVGGLIYSFIDGFKSYSGSGNPAQNLLSNSNNIWDISSIYNFSSTIIQFNFKSLFVIIFGISALLFLLTFIFQIINIVNAKKSHWKSTLISSIICMIFSFMGLLAATFPLLVAFLYTNILNEYAQTGKISLNLFVKIFMDLGASNDNSLIPVFNISKFSINILNIFGVQGVNLQALGTNSIGFFIMVALSGLALLAVLILLFGLLKLVFSKRKNKKISTSNLTNSSFSSNLIPNSFSIQELKNLVNGVFEKKQKKDLLIKLSLLEKQQQSYDAIINKLNSAADNKKETLINKANNLMTKMNASANKMKMSISNLVLSNEFNNVNSTENNQFNSQQQSPYNQIPYPSMQPNMPMMNQQGYPMNSNPYNMNMNPMMGLNPSMMNSTMNSNPMLNGNPMYNMNPMICMGMPGMGGMGMMNPSMGGIQNIIPIPTPYPIYVPYTQTSMPQMQQPMNLSMMNPQFNNGQPFQPQQNQNIQKNS